MKLKPLSNNLIVRAALQEEVTKSGIVLPASAEQDKPEKGEVVAVGPGKLNDEGKLITMSVKVGDKIVFKKYSPDEIKIDDKEYLILSENDVVAIIEE
ncbi:MAG: co-chaperone GroES [Clostridia bacterium]|nr:co-chaperone GroES [Clostridia bacterium]